MQADRFFHSTRGKIATELRSRRAASAVDLAQAFGLSPNAIRQQLMALERDGLVAEKSVRRGPTKPTHEFSLTPAGEKLFPQQYDKMLAAVLREVREQFGSPGVAQVFDGISKRAVSKAKSRLTGREPETKVAQLVEMLREHGVVADYSLIDGGFQLHEHNCPYAEVVKEHPEVCSVIHTVLDEAVGGQHVQTESLATGGGQCRFELKVST
ncbi:MAG: hypothetical protein M3M96_04145 [Candidatus Eremiobacteraeota bacterium]|nr:hypothetical protein [Candidatus Eremiobacteraeota bacterium]